MNARDPRERDLVKCEDMRIHAERALEFVGSRTVAEFLANRLLQDATIRCVEVIGEAARQVSEPTCLREPEIPWAVIIGMRNILVHDYGSIDLGQVYRVVTDHLPNLLGHLQNLIRHLETEVGWQGHEDGDGK